MVPNLTAHVGLASDSPLRSTPSDLLALRQFVLLNCLSFSPTLIGKHGLLEEGKNGGGGGGSQAIA